MSEYTTPKIGELPADSGNLSPLKRAIEFVRQVRNEMHLNEVAGILDKALINPARYNVVAGNEYALYQFNYDDSKVGMIRHTETPQGPGDTMEVSFVYGQDGEEPDLSARQITYGDHGILMERKLPGLFDDPASMDSPLTPIEVRDFVREASKALKK